MFDRVRAAFDKALGYLPLTMLRGLSNPKSPSAAYLLEEKVRETVQGPGIRVRFLPLNDGYTRETPEMRAEYRVMVRDPYIKQSLLTKILGVASLDLQVHPVSKSPYDKQVADFCKWSVEKSKGGLRKLVFDTLWPAMIEGYSVSEKLWMIENYGQYKGKIRLKGIKSKDIKHLELMGDDFRNVTGIRDLRGWAPTGYQGYHPDNFIMYSHLSLFESPTGMSDFRAIYRAYWLIDTAWELRAIGLERFGLPMMMGTYSHDDQKPVMDTALSLMRSQSWVSLPEGAKMQALELAARGTADFESAIKDLREEIVIGIAGAMLHMMQGDAGAGARGNSKVQKSTTELQQWMLAAQVGDIITEQIFPDLVSFNYPGAEPPSATLGSVSDDEMAASLDVDKFFLTVARQPLSREAIYKAYNRQEPTSPEDTIAPPPLPSGPGGAPAPSAPPTVPPRDSGPPGADPGTDITDVPPVTPDAGPEAMNDHGSDPDFFCGGKGGTPGPCPTKSGTASSQSTLSKAVDASKAVVGKVKAGVDAIKAKLDAKTNGPVLKQVKAVFGVAKEAMDKVNAKMEERYGKAGARAIFWGGQALGANPLVAPAWFIALPGATFLAQLPLAAGAEAILQTSRAVKGVKSAMGFAETTPPLKPSQAQSSEYLADLYREFYAALEPMQGELAKTLAPLANVDKFTDQSKTIDLPDHRQKDDYDCGAATYGAVLAHHGKSIPEAELVKSLGTTKTNGTSPVAIIAHARDSGLSVSARPNMSLADLRSHVDAGRPVICPIQDAEPSKESNGHYVAVIGYGPGTIHVHDPVAGRVTWPKAKFDSHWHDRDGRGIGYTRFGIAIGGGPDKFCGGKGGTMGPCAVGGGRETGDKKNRVPEQKPNEKSERAKAAHVMVNKDIQRYAEEYNEPRLAAVLGGVSHPNSEPMDITAKNGDLVEMKTMVDNGNQKITMDSYSQVRKITKEQETGKTFHTVVSDDSKIYNAKGDGKHGDDKDRTYYYRRGVAGSARIGSLYQCKDENELKSLMKMPEDKLPPAAQRTDGHLTDGKWKPFQDDQGKGFVDKKSGRIVRAKK